MWVKPIMKKYYMLHTGGFGQDHREWT